MNMWRRNVKPGIQPPVVGKKTAISYQVANLTLFQALGPLEVLSASSPASDQKMQLSIEVKQGEEEIHFLESLGGTKCLCWFLHRHFLVPHSQTICTEFWLLKTL